jgi:phosphate transport system substrate-binding protein
MKRNFFKSQHLLLASALMFALSFTSCNGGGASTSGTDSTASSGNSDDNTLLGGGSTFDNPLFSKLFSEYNKANGLKVNYQSIGSGGGILQLTNKTIDFGASDAPLNGKQDSALLIFFSEKSPNGTMQKLQVPIKE